jgi:hypothetical protein
MTERELNPIERDIVEAYRAIKATSRGEMHVFITPEVVDIVEGKRRRHECAGRKVGT